MLSPIRRKYIVVTIHKQELLVGFPVEKDKELINKHFKIYENLDVLIEDLTNDGWQAQEYIIPIIENDETHSLVWREMMDYEGNNISRMSYLFDSPFYPKDGYVLPKIGDKIKSKVDYQTPAFSQSHHEQDIIKAGEIATVRELRHPIDKPSGYLGIWVDFPLKSYPAGIIIPWDKISDNELFETVAQ